MEISKENMIAFQDRSLKAKGNFQEMNPLKKSQLKKKALTDVGNTVHLKSAVKNNIGNFVKPTKSVFGIKELKKTETKPRTKSINMNEIDEKFLNGCRCQINIKDIADENLLPKSMQLSDEDIRTLATDWEKPFLASKNLSKSPIVKFTPTNFEDEFPSTFSNQETKQKAKIKSTYICWTDSDEDDMDEPDVPKNYSRFVGM